MERNKVADLSPSNLDDANADSELVPCPLRGDCRHIQRQGQRGAGAIAEGQADIACLPMNRGCDVRWFPRQTGSAEPTAAIGPALLLPEEDIPPRALNGLAEIQGVES